MSSGYWRAACINMVLAIVTTVLIERSADPFWYEVPAPLKLIFWLFFNIYYIKSDEFKTPLSVCYPLVTTPWLLFSLSRVSFALTISVAFIVSWCLMLIYSLKCSTKNTRPRTSQLGCSWAGVFCWTFQWIYEHQAPRYYKCYWNCQGKTHPWEGE